jgi:hypothetical protein
VILVKRNAGSSSGQAAKTIPETASVQSFMMQACQKTYISGAIIFGFRMENITHSPYETPLPDRTGVECFCTPHSQLSRLWKKNLRAGLQTQQ